MAVTLGFFVLTSAPAAAQSLDIGANYNYVHTNAPPGGCGCFALNGGSAWLGVNLTRSFGIVGEVASQHGSDSSGDLMLTSYLAGPRYTVHGFDRFKPFGQVLVGGAHASGRWPRDHQHFRIAQRLRHDRGRRTGHRPH